MPTCNGIVAGSAELIRDWTAWHADAGHALLVPPSVHYHSLDAPTPLASLHPKSFLSIPRQASSGSARPDDLTTMSARPTYREDTPGQLVPAKQKVRQTNVVNRMGKVWIVGIMFAITQLLHQFGRRIADLKGYAGEWGAGCQRFSLRCQFRCERRSSGPTRL